MVDREDGIGAGFTGVLPAEEQKNCQMVCTGHGENKSCEFVCDGEVVATNINQCTTGRNKCSENAACKDLPDEMNENNELIRKLRYFLIITDSVYSSNVQLSM